MKLGSIAGAAPPPFFLSYTIDIQYVNVIPQHSYRNTARVLTHLFSLQLEPIDQDPLRSLPQIRRLSHVDLTLVPIIPVDKVGTSCRCSPESPAASCVWQSCAS